MPKREDFERTLGKIYGARSKATHEGQPFPVSASYTGGPIISTRAAAALFGAESPFPPVVWFERIVNSALCGFWERAMPPRSSPPPAPPRTATRPVEPAEVKNLDAQPRNDTEMA